MGNNEKQSLARSLIEIESATTGKTLENSVHAIVLRYGLRTAAYLGAGITAIRQNKPYLAVTYSSAWVDHYKSCRYVEIDPVIRMGMRRLLPLDWDEFGEPKGVLKTFFGEASEFGLGRRGLTIPVHGMRGDRALFTITSDLSEREWRTEKFEYMRGFQIIAMHLHDKVLQMVGHRPAEARFSPRELECLQWIAEGKTTWECAIILGLSQHTVRCYLESARHKLKAMSNTHAVSIAHRSGLLIPIL